MQTTENTNGSTALALARPASDGKHDDLSALPRSSQGLTGHVTRPITPADGQADQPGARHVGYGLPCSKCGAYYTADQSVCPICECAERVSPIAIAAPPVRQNAQPLLGEAEEPGQKHGCFQKESQSQLFSAHLQIDAASFRCSLEENHQGGHEHHEPAAICKPCYGHLQERADLMEAALHIDLKEAAQIVYEALWSDPSDPSKHQDAAQALLTELRKRSAIDVRSGVRG